MLRRLRRRSLAALRHELEPVPPAALAQFLPQWQHIGKGHGLRGTDGLVRAVEQLQGASVPASALEKLVLPSRVANYAPAMLDELTSAERAGVVTLSSLPGKDGWISLYLADAAPLLLPPPHPLELTALHQSILDTLFGGYGLFFRQITDQIRATTHPDVTDPQLADALWDLAWSGLLTNDTLAPMRSLLGSGRTAGSTAHRAKRTVPRGRYGSLTAAARPTSPHRSADRRGPLVPAPRSRTGPHRPRPRLGPHPARPARRGDPGSGRRGGRRGRLLGDVPHPVRLRGEWPGAARLCRGGLGAAQFAMDGAVDRLRAVANARDRGDELPTPDPTDNDPYGFGTLGDSTSRMTGSGNDSAADHGRHGTSGSPESTTSPTPSARSPTSTTSTAWGQRTAASPTRALPRPGTAALRPPTPGPGRLRLPATSPPRHPRATPVPLRQPPHPPPLPRYQSRGPGRRRPGERVRRRPPWPEPPTGAGHKPGRKAGSLVVLVEGELTLYMERGGKTLLAWPSAPDTTATEDPRLQAAAEALAAAARAGSLGTVTVERVNGTSALTELPIGTLLEGAGFIATPRGLRLRA